MLRGALAAAVTPLRDDGEALDEDAFPALVEFLAAGGVDGIFALGTTGEGILLSAGERRRAAELFLEAAAGRLAVVVHCGAQTTTETASLAAHAAERGADAVAAVAPPYYSFDEHELLEHFTAAAAACAPTPFFLYEFAARSGYPIPLAVVERLRERAPNLAGLKVSDIPFEGVEPYLLEGFAVFVGSEPLYPPARDRGAAGTVSGLAAAFPELVAALVTDPARNLPRVAALREASARLPFIGAMKHVLARRGVPVRGDVRAPLRPLREDERQAADALFREWVAAPAATPSPTPR